MMKFEQLESGSVRVLRYEGDIDEEGVNTLRLSLSDCLQDQRCNVVVNLGAVNFVSYLGVGVLVERLRQFRNLRGDLKLSCVNTQTERLMRMAGVQHLFEMHETESQAIQSFREAA